MRTYSFNDVAYYVKNEIETITEKYTEYVDFFTGELERDKSKVNCENAERYMLREKNKFFVILKRHVELLPTVINKCTSTIDFEEIGTLYRIENNRNTSWIYASKLEENERYQITEDLRKKINEEIEKKNISLTEDDDVIEEIKKANEMKKEQALKERQEEYENQKSEIEYLEAKIKKAKKVLETKKDALEKIENGVDIQNIKQQLEAIKNNKYVEKVEFKELTQKLRITTKDIYMTSPEIEDDIRYLGKMQIDINLNNYIVRFKNLNNTRYNYWGEDGPHPHVSSSGSACLGNLSDTLAIANQGNDLYIAVLQCIGFLQTYDPSDCAGAYYRAWDRVDENGNILEEGNMDIYECDVCGERYEDEDEMYYCEHCGKRICPNCEQWVEEYEYSVCPDCFDEFYVQCEECGRNVLRNDAEQDSNGDWYCSECAEECLAECANCGNFYNKENMKEVQDDDTGEVYYLCNACR